MSIAQEQALIDLDARLAALERIVAEQHKQIAGLVALLTDQSAAHTLKLKRG